MRLDRLLLFGLLLLPVGVIVGCDTGADSTSQGRSPNGPHDASQATKPARDISRSTDAAPPAPGPIRFVERTAETGIDFVHFTGDNAEKPFPAANGSGIAAFDYDRDGWNDLLFLSGAPFPLGSTTALPTDRFYRNRGNWQFVERTGETGLGSPVYSAGVVTGDFNSDGFPDVYVNCYGRNLLYWNQGDGTFREAAVDAGVDDTAWGTSAACLDFDDDGDLDLYVCNYAEWTWETNQFCGNREKKVRIFCSPKSVKPVPDRLYENLGDGHFRDVLETAGLNREPGRGQGVVAADVDGDGRSDLYVGNDINANFLFRNAGGGTFEDLTELSGTAVDFAGRPQAGMGVDVADINRDGRVEIFVTNYEDEHNAIYMNLGNNLFQDAGQSSGLAAPSMRYVGWGTSFSDFDGDGWSDLVVANGHTDNNLDQMGRDARFEQPPLLFHNHEGRLQPIHPSAGTYFRSEHPGRSLCVADLDGDLDPDLVIGHQDLPPAILQNESPRPENRQLIQLRLVGLRANRDGIGSRVAVLGSSPALVEHVKSGGSYLAARPGEITLSVPVGGPLDLEIHWPGAGGRVETVPAPAAAGRYTVIEGQGLISRNPLFTLQKGSLHVGLDSNPGHSERNR